MSAFNWFSTQAKALDLRTKLLTTSSSVTTYTAKVGRSADNFIFDRVIRVTSTSGNNMSVALPNGIAYGQQLLIIFEVEASTETVDVTVTTGDAGTQLTAAGGYNRFEWHGGTLGWCLIASSAT